MSATTAANETLCEARHTRLLRRDRWEYVERRQTTRGVVLVAVTAERKLLLVEQYRAPLHARVLELPAGLVGDEPGLEQESIKQAAARELGEETGYQAASLEPVWEGPPSAGICNETVVFVWASELRKVGDGGGDEHEDILVHTPALKGIEGWLQGKKRQGVLVDPKIYAGLYLAHARLAEAPTP